MQPNIEALERELQAVRARRRLPAPPDRRAIREEAGLSLRQLAGVLGVDHTVVAQWEAGGQPRKANAVGYLSVLEHLARECGCDLLAEGIEDGP